MIQPSMVHTSVNHLRKPLNHPFLLYFPRYIVPINASFTGRSCWFSTSVYPSSLLSSSSSPLQSPLSNRFNDRLYAKSIHTGTKSYVSVSFFSIRTPSSSSSSLPPSGFYSSFPFCVLHRHAFRFLFTVASSSAADTTSTLSENDYHRIADETLARIELNVTPLEDTVDGFDLSNAMGVLTIKLGTKGTYVLNKQSANKQIWWSSPISGPRRYNYDVTVRDWISSRDGHRMVNCLHDELVKLTGKKLVF